MTTVISDRLRTETKRDQFAQIKKFTTVVSGRTFVCDAYRLADMKLRHEHVPQRLTNVKCFSRDPLAC
jgi:hypothetical protein